MCFVIWTTLLSSAARMQAEKFAWAQHEQTWRGASMSEENGVFPNKRTHVEMVWVEMARKFAQRL